jgi:hypothetical protein
MTLLKNTFANSVPLNCGFEPVVPKPFHSETTITRTLSWNKALVLVLAPGDSLDWKDCTMGTPARRILRKDGQEWPSYIQGQFEYPALATPPISRVLTGSGSL